MKRAQWIRLIQRTLAFVMILGLAQATPAKAQTGHDEHYPDVSEAEFSVLILGDSQMAGVGWKDGYANCIKEAYPNAKVINLAQDGKLLTDGGILGQWDYYLEKECPMPDVILMDGGANDLFYLPRDGHIENWVNKVCDTLHYLLEKIHLQSPDTQVIYCTFPPLVEWNDPAKGPPEYKAQKIFWKKLVAVSNTFGHVTVLDLFSLNSFHYPCRLCYQEYLADSVHLNENGYRKTFEHIDSILAALLAEKLE
ncbi:MAG: SGNH/GDSL hydrolase family protein [Clostridiales bacterium]|nr:SGNH/GDSL hydrolase family protein [Clostridiales bacterium]